METLSYQDFRGFVEAAKKISDWRLIEGADWENEIGALIESTAEQRPLVAPPPPVMGVTWSWWTKISILRASRKCFGR